MRAGETSDISRRRTCSRPPPNYFPGRGALEILLEHFFSLRTVLVSTLLLFSFYPWDSPSGWTFTSRKMLGLYILFGHGRVCYGMAMEYYGRWASWLGGIFSLLFRFGLCYFNHILGRTWLCLQPWHMVCMQGRQTAAAVVSHPNTFETMLELRCVDRLWLLLLNYPVWSTSA